MAAISENQDMGIEPEVAQKPEATSDAKMESSNKSHEGNDAEKKAEGDVEIASIDEPEKAQYSKKSVWLMILFSGLAIGSDG